MKKTLTTAVILALMLMATVATASAFEIKQVRNDEPVYAGDSFVARIATDSESADRVRFRMLIPELGLYASTFGKKRAFLAVDLPSDTPAGEYVVVYSTSRDGARDKMMRIVSVE